KERQGAIEKDIERFEKENLQSGTEDGKCFTASEDNNLIGASIIQHKQREGTPYMDFIVSERRLNSEFSKKLLEKTIDYCKEEGKSKLELSPKIYSERFLEFFREKGFEEDEKYPSGLWMRKELENISEIEIPEGIEMLSVDGFGDPVSAEDIAEIQRGEYPPGYDFEDIVALLKKMDRERDELLYTVAESKEDGEFVGYSRTMFVDLISGESIAHNMGLAVKEGYRNEGLGKALLQKSFKEVKKKGYDTMYISTHSNNPAQRLYKRVGFEVEREHPNLCYKINNHG
ncbi:MAG: GNAT family N-acetyltransferase, partial [Thermoplasmatota archaeon]